MNGCSPIPKRVLRKSRRSSQKGYRN